MLKFTLVMSVYAGEDPSFLSQCVESILAQTVLPDEWIIVKDGPLMDGLEAVLRGIAFQNELRIIALPENVTQGPARAEGIKAARYEWVAVMDSDDICAPDRFEKQLAMIGGNPGLDIIGGQISEFINSPKGAKASRRVPLNRNEITRFAKRRNPFNCMTVMLRRDLALATGNFQYFPWFEDYDLWTRMLAAGAVCANHADVLVYVRVGGGMYARRRGASYIRSELRMQRQLKDLGFIGIAGYAKNIALRVPVRLLPEKMLARVYNRFARTRGK